MSTALSYDTQARLSAVTLTDGTQVVLRYNSAGLRSRYTVSKGGTTVPRSSRLVVALPDQGWNGDAQL